jgi:membrane protease YdiL (CAAX protease family)
MVLLTLASSFLRLTFVLILVLFITRQVKIASKQYLVLFFLVVLVDDLLLRTVPAPIFFQELRWNWFGKLVDFSAAVVFVVFYKGLSRKEYGITLSLEKGSLKPVVISILGFIFLTTLSEIGGEFHLPSRETILYQLTMPGLSEELIFRGILLALLNKTYGTPWKLWGAHLGWGAIITTLLFGLVHGLSFSPSYEFQFNLGAILATGASGFFFVWLKERSKSLLPGILTHNLSNVIIQFF